MKALVFLEVDQGEVKSASYDAVKAATKLSDDIEFAVFAENVDLNLKGKIYTVSVSSFPPDPANLAQFISEKGVDIVFLPGTRWGNWLGASIAAELKGAFLPDVIDIDDRGFKREILSNKIRALFGTKTDIIVVTVRPRSFEYDGVTDGKPDFIPLAVQGDKRIEIVGGERKESDEVDIVEADVIVAGGRGVGGPEGFKLLREFADVLEQRGLGRVAIGASRAAVDEGWIDHAHQVGQTGKVVSPAVYIACGISGALQHVAGMNSSRIVVAINKDPQAPIFQYADYGIVGDLFEVIPMLIQRLKG